MSITATIQGGAGISASVTTKQISMAPSGWDDQVAEYGRGANYPPPTGQETVYRTGDDADIEATIFAPIRVANSLKVKNSLTDFTTLGNTNSFGNTDRFTDDAGGQTYTSQYVIDHYTGLGWFIIPDVQITWNNGIDNALAATDVGFSDWFLPNLNQAATIRNSEADNLNSFNYAPFNLLTNFVAGNNVGVSTTSFQTTTNSNYWAAQANIGMRTIAKTTNWDYLTYCRKHF